MIELVQNFQIDLQAGPLWVQIWVMWLVVINTVAILYAVSRVEARWVLLAWIVAMTGVMSLYYFQGFTRLLGLGHIIAWTPLLIYLWRRRSYIHLNKGVGVWLHLVFLSNFISLIFDYTDLARHFMGQGY